jgi:rhodanese-related sulfurtransferase
MELHMTPRPNKSFWQPLRRAGLQALGIIVAAAVLGLLVNALRPQGLELIRTAASVPPSSDSSHADGARPIELAAALEKLNQGTAIFIDARAEDDYRAGHIKTARNLPEKTLDIWMPEFFNATPPETELIVYCSGPRCRLAERLAAKLYEFGYPEVYHLTVGWNGWTAAGYPAETGF